MPKMSEDSLPAVVALILAGGNSRRMGSDKALVLWDGIPLLRRVAQVAAACADAVYILTPWPERYAPVVDPGWHLWRENVPPLVGQDPRGRDSIAEQHRGPLLAFQEGIRRLQTLAAPPEWILLLACDLPCLQEQVLGDWRQRLAALPLRRWPPCPKVSGVGAPVWLLSPGAARLPGEFLAGGGKILSGLAIPGANSHPAPGRSRQRDGVP
jgi:Molybdopterin-guanine dinucleotide biosynthesis protein A